MTTSNHNQKKPELDAADTTMDDKQRQLEGRQADDQQSAFADSSEVDELEELTPTDHYESEPAAGASDALLDDAENLDLLTEREMRAGETEDPFKAAEEGQTYVPPIDPPTLPSNDYENARIASGLGASAFSEPYNAEHHSSTLPTGDEMRARVYEALHADSRTSNVAEQVVVLVNYDTVYLRGRVLDLHASDTIAAVASNVEGVAEVVDELQVAGME